MVPQAGRQRRSDAELLAAHIDGDRYAFAELFGRHHGQLRRLARRTTRSPEDAADALQDAMLAAHRCAGSFRCDGAVGGWLHRIVVNACLDGLRGNRRRHTAALDADLVAVPDRTTEVETAILVHRALLRLPTDQRAAVVVVDMHGYSITDAARLLGVAEGTIKSRCARARRRLAGLLDQLSAGGRVGLAH